MGHALHGDTQLGARTGRSTPPLVLDVYEIKNGLSDNGFAPSPRTGIQAQSGSKIPVRRLTGEGRAIIEV